MAKFYGTIGYAVTVEVRPDVWEEQIVERTYCGDLIRNTRRLDGNAQVNDNITIGNEISIVSDPYANENFILCAMSPLWGQNGRSRPWRSSIHG